MTTVTEQERLELLACAHAELEAAQADLEAARATLDQFTSASSRWSESRARFVPVHVGAPYAYVFPEPLPSAATGPGWAEALEIERLEIEDWDAAFAVLAEPAAAAQARVDAARAAVQKWSEP